MSYGVGSGVAVWVRLGGGVGVGVGVPATAKMSASCRIASMVWAPKRAKGAAGAGFVRASERRLDKYMAASAEEISDMASLWRKKSTVFAVNSPRVSGT